jgi:transcription initiation factor IIE alpha subunit
MTAFALAGALVLGMAIGWAAKARSFARWAAEGRAVLDAVKDRPDSTATDIAASTKIKVARVHVILLRLAVEGRVVRQLSEEPEPRHLYRAPH